MNLSAKALHKLLRYEPDTGKLFWRKRSADAFEVGKRTAQHSAKIWNKAHANKEAFTSSNDSGYRVGAIHNRNQRAHRVIWAMVHGKWPLNQIDHINGIRDDNRIANLRDVTPRDNQRNAAISKNNSSGCVGVYWDDKRAKWASQITVNGKNNFLGYFVYKFDAILARLTAEKEHGFHINHGRKI